MATSIGHYLEAERLLRRADALSPSAAEEQALLLLQEAQVHATLALAAVTAMSQGFDGPPLRDYDAWFKAASVEAPIPAEADDPDEGPITEGSMSPGPHDDPGLFAGWMRAVPPGSTLTDNDGDGWYRLVSLDTSANRRRQTIVGAGGGDVHEIGDHDDMVDVQESAPFTVLTLGILEGGE